MADDDEAGKELKEGRDIKLDAVFVIRITLVALAVVDAIMSMVFLIIDATNDCPEAGRYIWYCFGFMVPLICVVAVWLNDFWILSVFWILEFILICTWREATKGCRLRLYRDHWYGLVCVKAAVLFLASVLLAILLTRAAYKKPPFTGVKFAN